MPDWGLVLYDGLARGTGSSELPCQLPTKRRIICEICFLTRYHDIKTALRSLADGYSFFQSIDKAKTKQSACRSSPQSPTSSRLLPRRITSAGPQRVSLSSITCVCQATLSTSTSGFLDAGSASNGFCAQTLYHISIGQMQFRSKLTW